MKRTMLPIVLSSLLLGLLFDFMFYGKAIGISLFIYCGTILAILFGLAGYYRHTLSKSIVVLGPLVLVFAGMTFVRASAVLSFLNVVFVLYLLLLIALLTWRPHSKLQDYTAKEYIRHILLLPFEFIGQLLALTRRLISNRSEIKVQKHSLKPVIRGIIFAVPFLLVFLLLLSSADLVFGHYIKSLFDFNVSVEAIFRLMLILFVASLSLGTYTLILTTTRTEDQAQPNPNQKINLGTIEASIVLGSVAFLFLVFVIIQITYLFGGQNNITSAGFTYAQYARKGFFELIAVAVISLALILAVHASTIRQTLKQKVVFMWLSGMLILEVLVMMLSAHKRLSLYEQAYGFTELRLYSHVFIGWLAVIFILLLLHIFREQRENQFAFHAFISVIAFLLLLNFINPDAFIARRNIQRFNATGKVDVCYLGELSEDATPELGKLLQSSNTRLQGSVGGSLHFQKSLLDTSPSHWQSFNIARSNAHNFLRANSKQLENYKDYACYSGKLDK